MSCTDWTNILLGALFGAVLGFCISEFRLYISARRKKIRLKKHYLPYEGHYEVRTKGGQPSGLHSVAIKYLERNVLAITLETSTNGKAEGYLIMDESTHSTGKAFYKHTDLGREHLSGFFDIMFFEPGVIHAKVSYLLGATRKEINEFYIWKKIFTVNK